MKIDFEFQSPYGTYRDCLNFADDAVPDEATIESLKQERFNNWITAVTTQVTPAPSKYLRNEAGELILDEFGDPILAGE